MQPTTLFNPSSISGVSLVNFTIDTQVTIAALGLPAGASVNIEMVQISTPVRDQICPGSCEIPAVQFPSETAWQPLMCCEGKKVTLNAASPYIVIDAPQHVRLRALITGYDFSAAPFPGEVIVYPSTSTITNDTMRGCCPDPVVIAPPAPQVTATVSICPVPACFTWGGAQYSSIAAFVSDVKDLVPGAGYNPLTCTFSAPAGTVFPSLAIVACVPVVVPPAPPVYCPSLRLDTCDCREIGFAYRLGDSIDPAATVLVLACDGTTVGFAYPTPRVGATVPYEENNVIIGYLQNQSACAPEASQVINNYVTTNVAAPVVSVAAPTVVLPAPTVASQVLDANDAIVTTLTDGTVFTTPLSNC
jgi:hypothetical protein